MKTQENINMETFKDSLTFGVIQEMLFQIIRFITNPEKIHY